MKALTKREWKEKRVYNSHEIARRGGGYKVYVSYRPAEWGRASQSAAWQVVRIGYKTDPKSHWRDDGHKTFTILSRDEKSATLNEALSWAMQRYGVKEWERDPWGDWHPAGTLEKAANHTEVSNGEK